MKALTWLLIWTSGVVATTLIFFAANRLFAKKEDVSFGDCLFLGVMWPVTIPMGVYAIGEKLLKRS
jgi:hypothetical protein